MTRTLHDFYGFREELVSALEADVMGPTASDEVIDEAPLTHYITGILYPQSGEAIDPSQDIDLTDDDDDTAVADPPVAMANVRYPSSMGLSFAVDSSQSTQIVVRAQAGRYEQLQSM